jgi:hypothetical protein
MTTVSLYNGYQPYLNFISIGGNSPGFEPEKNVENAAGPSSPNFTFQYGFFDGSALVLNLGLTASNYSISHSNGNNVIVPGVTISGTGRSHVGRYHEYVTILTATRSPHYRPLPAAPRKSGGAVRFLLPLLADPPEEPSNIQKVRQMAIIPAAAAREFESSAFAGVPASPDLEWLRGCVDYLVQRDA